MWVDEGCSDEKKREEEEKEKGGGRRRKPLGGGGTTTGTIFAALKVMLGLSNSISETNLEISFCCCYNYTTYSTLTMYFVMSSRDIYFLVNLKAWYNVKRDHVAPGADVEISSIFLSTHLRPVFLAICIVLGGQGRVWVTHKPPHPHPCPPSLSSFANEHTRTKNQYE